MVERKQSGRLRSSQLIHIPIAWTDSSGFEQNGTCFRSQFISSEANPFTVARYISDGKLAISRKNGDLPIKLEGQSDSRRVVATQTLGAKVAVVVEDSEGSFSFDFNQTKIAWKSKTDPQLFKFRQEEGVAYVISKSDSPWMDCLSRHNSSQCIDSKPIRRAKSYFYDDDSRLIVTVGTEDSKSPQMRGIFVQAVDPKDSSIKSSFTIPFINRYDEGLWVFQNAPLTDGFLVLLPVIGFPPAPVQHVIVLRDISPEVPLGTVLRMENASLRLFRKVDTVSYNPILKDNPCSC